jgi:DNA-binding beta-propeller fold protein YncE
LGMSPAAAVLTADASTLYVSDPAAGHVVPVAINIRQVAHPISVGQDPHTGQMTPGDDILVVVDTASDELAIVRAKTSGLITLIPTGAQPHDLAIKVF